MNTNPVRKLKDGVVLIELRPGLETIVGTRIGLNIKSALKSNLTTTARVQIATFATSNQPKQTMNTTNPTVKRNQYPLPNLSYRWTQLGTSVVVNFGFGKGKLGEITGFNAMFLWFTQPFGHEKLMPAYEVTFYSEQHARRVTCTYEENDLI